MTFNDTATKNGLIQQCEINLFGDNPFGTISGNADRLAIFTNFIDEAYSKYAILALQSDNSWQFDDSNYTDFPIATTDLVANQPDYTLATEHIIIDQVEILDTTGTIWRALPEIDERQFTEYQRSLSQFNNNVPGQPIYHAKIGASIYLFPTPIYSVTNGVKVRFKRAPDFFVVGDTTKEPGFTSLHHTYLSDYATWRYSFSRGMPMYARYQDLVVRWEQADIPAFFADRSLEHPTIMRSKTRRTR